MPRKWKKHTSAAPCARVGALWGNTGSFPPKNQRKTIFLALFAVALFSFPTRILLFLLFPLYFQYQVCLCVWDTISVSLLISPRPVFRCSHSLHCSSFFLFSFFNPLLLFPTLCVSTTSPPCGQFINDTVETEGIKTSQTHLPYGPQK